MRELLTVIVSWTAITALTSLVLRVDEARLRGERRARSFPRSTRLSVTFGLALMSPLQVVAIPVHFARTRRSVLWTLAGLVLAVVVVFVGGSLALAVDSAPELPFPTEPRAELVAASIVELALFGLVWAILRAVSRPPRA